MTHDFAPTCQPHRGVTCDQPATHTVTAEQGAEVWKWWCCHRHAHDLATRLRSEGHGTIVVKEAVEL